MTFSSPPSRTTRPTLTGTFGMSASTHWLASAASQAVLERGGNAFDAVVAGGFVLHVVEPHLNGPGGDLVGLFQACGDAAPRVLVGQGPAPAGASIEHFRDEGLDSVPGAGALAAAVPGAVDAWLLLLRDYGTWELADVLGYAIGYARHGYPMLPQTAATIGRVAELFRDRWPTSAALWMPDGEPPVAGSRHRNPDYAEVLAELAASASASDADDSPVDRASRIDAARAAWRERVGPAIENFVSEPHRHSSGSDHRGVMTAADISSFRAGYEEPVSARFRGRTVYKAGAWTQGPALLQALRLLDPLDDRDLDPGSAHGAHNVVEALKLALADRDAHFGDGVDVAPLLAEPYLAGRRTTIGETASLAWRPGSSTGREPFTPPLQTPTEDSAGPAPAGIGEPTVAKAGDTRGDTCHIDVVDRWGNIVSVTPSGGWLQSSPTIPGLGFCLGTRLQMAWLDERSPSALRPGKRPRTTLSPTLVADHDRATMALGTPGGDQQDQWQLPLLLRMIVGGWSAQAAIDAPILHTTAMIDSFWPRTWTPGGVVAEDRLGHELVAALTARGHDVTVVDGWSLGRLSAVGIDRASGMVWAAANPRGMQGYAAGR